MAPSAGARWGGSEGTKVLCLLHPTSFRSPQKISGPSPVSTRFTSSLGTPTPYLYPIVKFPAGPLSPSRFQACSPSEKLQTPSMWSPQPL